jgi:hypothetical protein
MPCCCRKNTERRGKTYSDATLPVRVGVGTERAVGPFPAGLGRNRRKDVKKQVRGAGRGWKKTGKPSCQQLAANGGCVKNAVCASDGSRSSFRLKSGTSGTLGQSRVESGNRGKAAWTVPQTCLLAEGRYFAIATRRLAPLKIQLNQVVSMVVNATFAS